MSVSYSFFLKNPVGNPISYGGCHDLDVAIRRYKELSRDPLTGTNGVIVMKNTHTIVSEDISDTILSE